jgi:VanZ family protein
MLLMFWLSSRSDFPEPGLLPEWLPIDKLAHLLLFAVLAALLYLAGVRAPLAALVAAAYGLTDEVHQMFVPGRSPDVRDWLADALGAMLGAWAVRRWEVARRRRAQAVTMSRDQRDA